jgi:hypothetical protein
LGGYDCATDIAYLAAQLGDPTLKLRWTISSQAALKPFGCPRDQLNQHIVPNVAFHI